jgi:hypothetical protein
MLLIEVGRPVGLRKNDGRAYLVEEKDRREDDGNALDNVAHAVRHGAHSLQRVERKLRVRSRGLSGQEGKGRPLLEEPLITAISHDDRIMSHDPRTWLYRWYSRPTANRSPQNLAGPTAAMAFSAPATNVDPSAMRARGTQMMTEMSVV